MPAFTLDQYKSAFIHEVTQSLSERYYVVVSGGDLKVFNRDTGVEENVSFPDGKAYLTSTKGFKAVTVGGTTYLVNLDTLVKRGTKKAAAPANEALIYIRQADFSTNYSITINGIRVTYTTPDAAAPSSRQGIATSSIVANLLDLLLENRTLTAEFDIGYIGLIQDSSTITVRRFDGADFTIATADGLADKGLKLVKGSVQVFTDLPEKAFDGMIVEVTGDPESSVDNYWVRFDSAANSGHGTWTECPAPGSPLDLDAATMPWTLARKGSTTTGLVDNHTLPMPSVTDITTVSSSAGFTSNPDTSTTYTGDDSIVLNLDSSRLTASAAVGTGDNRTLTVTYDADAGILDPGENFTVHLWYNGVLRDFRTYFAGTIALNEQLKYTGAITAGQTIQVQIFYGGGATPPSASRQGFVTFHGGTAAIPGIQISETTAVKVAFVATEVYPMGAVITLTANGHTLNHTVTGADETGLVVANALATAMVAFFTVVNAGDGSFTASSGGSTITWTVAASFTFSGNYFFSKTAALTAGALVGMTLVNDTDGSEGTITANSIHCIQTSGMAGGISNVVKTADTLHVIGVAIADVGFVFSKGAWDERKAGDLKVCPLPSFVDRTIKELFFHKNRLGFTTAGGFIVLSQSGVFSNFMRQTATALLADDVIDFKSSDAASGDIEHAVDFDDGLFLFSAAGHQYALTGEPALTPQTFSLEKKSGFPVSPRVRPIAMGKHLFFPRLKSSFSSVLRYFLMVNGKADAVDVTEIIPKYLPGDVTLLTGDAALGLLIARTDGADDSLWVHSFRYDGDETGYAPQHESMSSWSKWVFPGATIVAASMSDGILALLMVRADGAYLETLDLGVVPDGSVDYRDRQGSGAPVNYVSKYRFSTLFLRNKDDDATVRGRLQLRYGTLSYHDTVGFKVTVTPEGRDQKQYTFNTGTVVSSGGFFSGSYFSTAYFSSSYFQSGATSGAVGGPEEGEFTFPILTRNITAVIEIESTGADGCAFSGLDWEGDYTTRDRRV